MRLVSGKAGVVGLALFLAVDVVLVALALGSTRTPVSGAGSTTGASASTTTTSTSPQSSAGSTTATGATATRVRVVPVAAGIVAVDPNTAVRFVVGSCDKAGSAVEVTRDGGATWAGRPTPFDAVVRVRVRADKSAFAVGADKRTGCKPAIRQAPSLTGAWGDSVEATDVWFRDPRTSQSIGLASGGTGTPCPNGAVVDLAVVDAGAAALCATGDVLASKTGSQWTSAGSVPGALAVALNGKAQAYAVVPSAGACVGLAVVSPASPGTVVGCVRLDLGTVTPGSVALSVSSDSGWLRVGQAVYRADGSLSTWKSA
jgi:hypothetical protein